MYPPRQHISLLVLALFFCWTGSLFAQSDGKLPQSIFIKLINSAEKMELNHATQFSHVDLPEKYRNTFLSYIKDTTATEIPALTSQIYYSWQLRDGQVINGDVYWKDNMGYVVFKIDNKKYVNSFTKEGIAQLKSIFKL